MTGSFVLLWLLLAATAFGAGNAFGSLLAFVLWKTAPAGSPLPRKRLLFALRLAPTALGLAVALIVLTPAWLEFESHRTRAVPGPALVFAGALALALAARGALRGARAAWQAWSVARAWSRDAERVAIPGTALSAFRIDHPFPVVALAGVLRPRIYVARQVLEACDADELAAVVRHEEAHQRARDNARILVMRSCGDVLGLVPAGRAIENEWAAAAEAAADESASRSKDAALDLASALVKVARLAGTQPVAAPVCVFYEKGAIAERVERLTLEGGRSSGSRRVAFASGVLLVVPVLLLLAASDPDVLARVHAAAEALVHL